MTFIIVIAILCVTAIIIYALGILKIDKEIKKAEVMLKISEAKLKLENINRKIPPHK